MTTIGDGRSADDGLVFLLPFMTAAVTEVAAIVAPALWKEVRVRLRPQAVQIWRVTEFCESNEGAPQNILNVEKETNAARQVDRKYMLTNASTARPSIIVTGPNTSQD